GGEGCHTTRKLVTRSSAVRSVPVLPETGTTWGRTRGCPTRTLTATVSSVHSSRARPGRVGRSGLSVAMLPSGWERKSSTAMPRLPFQDRLGVDRDVDVVADDDAAAVQDAMPVDAEVLPVDARRRDEACSRLRSLVDAVLPPRGLPLAEVLDVERHRPGDAAD